jgi:adenylate cyclase
VVSESIRTAVRDKVDAEFHDLGEQQVKNIPHPVRAFRLSMLERAIAAQDAKPTPVPSENNLPLPDKPSIAVLPFTNMSGNADQEYFSDGITADICTELSRFRSLFVIALNSTFTYKSQAVDVRTVAKELGVRYVLEGSVRRASNRVRVTGQLIDALTGNHLWAEKFDRVLEDIFAVQEEITRSIVTAIAPEIEASELERIGRVRPENFTAFELGMRAYAEVTEALPGTDHRLLQSGSQLAAKALAIDPRSVSALSAIACSKWQAVHYSLTSDRETTRQEGIDAATAAIAVDRADNRPYIWRGALRIYNRSGRKSEGLDDLRRAHELNPNDAAAMVHLGFGEAACGDPTRGRGYVLAAMRLSPRDPLRYGMYNVLGMAAFLAKDYQQGLEWSQRSYVERPNFTAAHRHAMLNCVGLGKFEQAREEADFIRRAAPRVFEHYLQYGDNFYADPEHNRRGLLFTRIAVGLEDPSMADALS